VSGLVRARVPERHAWTGPAVALALLALIAWTSALGARGDGELAEMAVHEVRDAGRWLATQPPAAKLVGALRGAPVYYSQARLLLLPASSSAETLAYLRKLGPDFLILRRSDASRTLYLADWFVHGVPSECAQVLRTFTGPSDDLSIYRWTCPATDPGWLDQWCPGTSRDAPQCVPTPHYVRATQFSRP
jgi:hypothetical protein